MYNFTFSYKYIYVMMEIEEDIVSLTDYCRPIGNSSNNIEVIETIDVSEEPEYPMTSKRRTSNVYDKELCKDNKPLTDFINKCLLLEQTIGMEKVINKVMLPSYVRADIEYKKSEKFARVVTKATQRLNNDPARKYTHISDIVDTLKLHAAKTNINPNNLKSGNVNVEKKRVNFITLSNKVSGKCFGKHKENRKRHSTEISNAVSPKKSKPEVIALDNDDDDVIPIDDESNKIIANDHDHEMVHDTATENDIVNDDAIEIQDSQELKIIEEPQTVQDKTENDISKFNNNIYVKEQNNEPTINIETGKEILGSNENLNDNKLLVPHKERIVRLEKPKPKKKEPAEMTEEEKVKRIIDIETKIGKYKNTIARLDLEEVTEDSANSPYYKSDRLQASIVKLYKELRALVGENPPERRKIRFHIKDDVPKGPIKELEKFLNKHTDDEGAPLFPDFSDVIRCVERANKRDNLGWSKAVVMKEAQVLFTYCGRELQKRRQKREWKHLRSQVGPEDFQADPAESDPELQARLEANRRLAKARETEVFSKFTRMQNDPPQPSTPSQLKETLQPEEQPSATDDSSSDEEPEPEPNPTVSELVLESNNNTGYPEIEASIVKQEPMKPVHIHYKGDVSLVIEISDSESDDDEIGTLVF